MDLTRGQKRQQGGRIRRELHPADHRDRGGHLAAQVGYRDTDGLVAQVEPADRAVGRQDPGKFHDVGIDHGATPACSAAALSADNAPGWPT